jgi:flavin-dependent dehydrogenase
VLLIAARPESLISERSWMSRCDPLSSQGILNAIQSGIAASTTVLRMIRGHSAEALQYEERNRRAFANYLNQHRRVYARETRWRDSEFWTRRRQFLTPLSSQGRTEEHVENSPRRSISFISGLQ